MYIYIHTISYFIPKLYIIITKLCINLAHRHKCTLHCTSKTQYRRTYLQYLHNIANDMYVHISYTKTLILQSIAIHATNTPTTFNSFKFLLSIPIF